MQCCVQLPMLKDQLENAVEMAKDYAGCHGAATEASMSDSPLNFPLSKDHLKCLVADSRDWIQSHGVLVRRRDEPNKVAHAPFVLYPTPFLKEKFLEACSIQEDVNLMTHKVAYDYDFLKQSLEQTIKVDEFTKRLWDIYDTVRKEGIEQTMSLGLLRSDYMMDACTSGSLKQVEVNTMAAGMGGLGTYVADYARHALYKYGVDVEKYCPPENKAVEGLGHGLLAGYQEYKNQFKTSGAVILFLVMDPEWNLYDQRAMEYVTEQLSQKGYKHPAGDIQKDKACVIRRSAKQMLQVAKLEKNKALYVDGMEVAVIYFRDMYGPKNFTSEKDWDLRLLLERSRAIKAPSINYQLAGSKKVQQELAKPGVINKFIKDPESASRVFQTFAGLYQLDHNEDGDKNVDMILRDPKAFVLKPQREGGGNNIFALDIPPVLEKMKDTDERTAWIGMDRLCPVISNNYMVRPDKPVDMQEVNSELGIFGAILGDADHIKLNRYCGYLLRTKPAEMSEGGTATGIGALDSPLLVDCMAVKDVFCCVYCRPNVCC